ncbi:hypothetical protein VTO73DRAFT_18 [Trametes versicolor]
MRAAQLVSLLQVPSQGVNNVFFNAVSAVTNANTDAPGPLAVVLGVVSLHALGLALSQLIFRLSKPPLHRLWYSDDILYEIFSYLDPADAAQAGLVCTHWHRNAAHASYREVHLHTSSTFSRSLARTLLHKPRLRRHVRHLTVVHCAWHPQNHLYEWVRLLPPYSLPTCRIFGVPDVTMKLQATIAVLKVRTEIAYFGYKYPEDVLRDNIATAVNPARRRWLQKMLAADWLLDRLRRYKDDIAAVSPRHSFPDAIDRFADGVQLAFRNPAQLYVVASMSDAEGRITRERVDAVLDVLGKFINAASILSATLTYDAPQSQLIAETDDEPTSKYFAPLRCLCVSGASLDDADFPSDTLLVGTTGVTRTRLTVAAAKAIVDRVWRGAMPDGRRLRVVRIQIKHDGPMDGLVEPCAVCALSELHTYYLL